MNIKETTERISCKKNTVNIEVKRTETKCSPSIKFNKDILQK